VRAHDLYLASRGVRVVFVGTGSPAMAASFAAAHAGPHAVLVDPLRRLFAAVGMRRSLWASLHWRLFVNAWRAWRAGFRQGRVQGDPWQQGGLLLLAADGRIVHRQVDRAGGDPLHVALALAALV
jgi:hypothetical protein